MDLNNIKDINVQIALEEENICMASENNHENDIQYHKAILRSLLTLKNLEEFKIEEIFSKILKETYLEVCSDETIINTLTSKSDVQALTASKFRTIATERLRLELNVNSSLDNLEKEKFNELKEIWNKYLETVDAGCMTDSYDTDESDSILELFNSKFEEYIGRPITISERYKYFPSNDD